ncbi:hypothetical protein NAEGRDRAFT_59966 [Naegleria gruberi]|uniref:Uncharacterized protein n=1 Tax=Naegleria gruberi TaxID=5762 RepID=D2W2W4_NAEGR|nr:uncharacterized protein NAEGRDRAFT_59966 [Naegleria gruberi]EFC36587.1 hypothetical protein NAEGRDRAFT_59966 [Naegleria gruberi]|eukprot:XP_002669331.1 hypothetical protein NAEGRDRAFT_59966 [Naegleria gruberi strain NEG-M]
MNDNQIMMNFQVEEFSKSLQTFNNCPDNEDYSNSFLSIFLGSETRDQIIQEILKHVRVKVECLPTGFQENQFFSPAQTKYSCYVNDQIRISVNFDDKYLDSLSQGQNVCDSSNSPNYFCSMLMEKCNIQLVSFVEGTNFENTVTELTTELSKLGMNSDSNQRVVTFHIPRPLQKRGKKKERASSVSKKIGFIQVIHSDSKKIVCRSDNIWIRSKSREEMETKKRRANNTLSKKVKKRKIKSDNDENQDSNKPDSTKPDLSKPSLQAPAPAPTTSKPAQEIPDLKPKLEFPFLPVMPTYLPNFMNPNLLSMIPVNPCCSLIPVQTYFDPSLSNQFSTTVNYFCQANADILELTQPNTDEFDFDFDFEKGEELKSPLSDISSKQCEINDNLWGEVSPLSDSIFGAEDDVFGANIFEF